MELVEELAVTALDVASELTQHSLSHALLTKYLAAVKKATSHANAPSLAKAVAASASTVAKLGKLFSFAPYYHITGTFSRHNKAECTNERVEREFTGTCHFCEKEGHRASNCPEKPAEICRNCKKEGMIR